MGAHELNEELIVYTQTVWGWRISHVVVSLLLLFMLRRVFRGLGALTGTLAG